tara:strand:- start:12972 stop:13094 length:123 start_codon:yes stop_codon:yes gene_type:complete
MLPEFKQSFYITFLFSVLIKERKKIKAVRQEYLIFSSLSA